MTRVLHTKYPRWSAGPLVELRAARSCGTLRSPRHRLASSNAMDSGSRRAPPRPGSGATPHGTGCPLGRQHLLDTRSALNEHQRLLSTCRRDDRRLGSFEGLMLPVARRSRTAANRCLGRQMSAPDSSLGTPATAAIPVGKHYRRCPRRNSQRINVKARTRGAIRSVRQDANRTRRTGVGNPCRPRVARARFGERATRRAGAGPPVGCASGCSSSCASRAHSTKCRELAQRSTCAKPLKGGVRWCAIRSARRYVTDLQVAENLPSLCGGCAR